MPRRTQAERRAASTRALEEAAIRALVELGAAGASTTEICKRAGLSQGALFQHYATKQDLLVAAVARLYDRLRAELVEALRSLPADRPVRAALELVWQAYANPASVATLELYHSSRTDPELRARLSPLLDAHWARMLTDAGTLLPASVLANPRLPERVALAVTCIQGAAPGAVIEGVRPAFLDHHLDLLADLVTQENP